METSGVDESILARGKIDFFCLPGKPTIADAEDARESNAYIDVDMDGYHNRNKIPKHRSLNAP